jgi:hypothetical protein
LAIEARANHHIEECVEKKQVTQQEAAAAQRLAPLAKWILLPRLAGRRRRIVPEKPPHNAVAKICARRNALVHVNFDRLKRTLPSKREVLSWFDGFVAAMEDMNVVLNRVRRPRQSVLRIGKV